MYANTNFDPYHYINRAELGRDILAGGDATRNLLGELRYSDSAAANQAGEALQAALAAGNTTTAETLAGEAAITHSNVFDRMLEAGYDGAGAEVHCDACAGAHTTDYDCGQ